MVIEYKDKNVFGYDKIKRPGDYIRVIIENYLSYTEKFKEENRCDLIDFLRTKIEVIYARNQTEEDISEIPFKEIWNCNTTNQLPWEFFEETEVRFEKFDTSGKYFRCINGMIFKIENIQKAMAAGMARRISEVEYSVNLKHTVKDDNGANIFRIPDEHLLTSTFEKIDTTGKYFRCTNGMIFHISNYQKALSLKLLTEIDENSFKFKLGDIFTNDDGINMFIFNKRSMEF